MFRTYDRIFLITTIVLLLVGFMIFASAALGVMAREGYPFSAIATSQVAAIVLGLGLMLLAMHVPYRKLRPAALPFLIISLLGTALVFVPGLGVEVNGARRWIELGPVSIQPAEFLKYAAVLFAAHWLALNRRRVPTTRGGLLPFMAFTGVIALLLLAQPDTGTLLVIGLALTGMYVAAGARLKDLVILGGAGVAALTALALVRPYIMERILTFLNPAADPLGASYQLQQSLIAVGSGGWFGRGFGQSVQKFSFLPEPLSDSIFSVAAEEFGFVGMILLLGLFTFFAWRGLLIASRASDLFGGLLAVGIVILIASQSLMNVASMLGVMPLTGVPLLFVSDGGTAMLTTLAGVGVVLSVSRARKRT
ncbi:putative lipid II flippase FtsW [Patescibacteria group bacterium]|jgi:cell division protein FtsW|nr:putative lipid II flippase FtsW [Patescibacteria group bacterium]